jgi:RNA polymerase sigma-70 factor (ECF subfamily)
LDRYTFDREYVVRLKAGDVETQRHFTAYFSDLLVIKLRSRLRSAQHIDDVKQETFLRVLLVLRRDGLEHPERLGAFVNSVCNNVLLELFRADKRTSPMDDAPEPSDDRDDPERYLVTQQRKALVRKVLDHLPAKDRELIEQVFLQERDKDQVCRDFQIDREYLRVLLHRARNRFRVILTGEDRSSAAYLGFIILAVLVTAGLKRS